MEKLTEEKLRLDYRDSEVCMGEMLASEPADGMTIEEAFEMYVKMMNYANGDKFYRVNGEYIEDFEFNKDTSLLIEINETL